ncbi:MAG: transposase [Ignavibacteria bacterium]|nr:transposase [Ignavibacteria bacterium]
MQTFQSSYTKAINIRYDRHGSLFQSHFKAKHVKDEKFYLALATYIHQNPIRSKLVDKAEDWEFSSYQDYIELRRGSLPNKEFLLNKYTINEILEITCNKLDVQHLPDVGHLLF